MNIFLAGDGGLRDLTHPQYRDEKVIETMEYYLAGGEALNPAVKAVLKERAVMDLYLA